MPLTYPLTTAQFAQMLRIRQITFDAPEQLEVNRTGGGANLRARIGPQLWTGEVQMGRLTRDEAIEHEVLTQVLGGPECSFLVFDTRRPGPRQDLTGAILGASVVTIASTPNAREMTLTGLPSGYVLRRGDYLAFEYGASPVRRALHRVVDPVVTANGSGTTPLFEIYPLRRPGVIVSSVTLVRASCKAVIVPGSLQSGRSEKTITDGMTFRWEQVLT
jgi:hypothetical protein